MGQSSLENAQEFTLIIIIKLRNIGEAVKEKRSERLTKIVMFALGTIGVRAVNNKSMIKNHILSKFAHNIFQYGDVIGFIIIALKENGLHAIDCDFSDDIIKSYSSHYLFKMGYDVTCFDNIIRPGYRHLWNPAAFIVGGMQQTRNEAYSIFLIKYCRNEPF